KLVDFGIAKAVLNTVKTETGVLKGKVAYMAPEQARGGKPDRRTDLFTMGIVLWEAITGKRLFSGDPLTILNKLLHEEIPRLSSEVPSIDPRLDDVVARALAKQANERYQTAEEMRDALDAYLRASGEPVRQADLGRALTAVFGEVRASVKQQIQ